MIHNSVLYSDQLINSLDDRFKGQCSGAYDVNYSTCCSNGECNEGEGKDIKTIFEEMGILTLCSFQYQMIFMIYFLLGQCITDEYCNGNLVCMTSGNMQCPAYNDNQLNGCCASP